jgi:hypothetical protein
MDSVLLSNSNIVLEGLHDMLEAALGPHTYIHMYVDVPTALLVIEIAKRSEDRDDWFLRGKWATIQSIQDAVDKCLDCLFKEEQH